MPFDISHLPFSTKLRGNGHAEKWQMKNFRRHMANDLTKNQQQKNIECFA